MKVKMLVALQGTRDGQDWPDRGAVIDLPADEARDMIAGGLAEAATKVEGRDDADTDPAASASSDDEGAAPKAKRGRAAKADGADA